MSWPAAMLAPLVSHAVGDVLLQTESQAVAKAGGLSEPAARLALGRHVAVYTLAFVPALVRIGSQTSAVRAVAVRALVALLHLLVDDGNLVRAWLRYVKRALEPALMPTIAVGESLHLVCLFGAVRVAAG
jgi:hypothetical protein